MALLRRAPQAAGALRAAARVTAADRARFRACRTRAGGSSRTRRSTSASIDAGPSDVARMALLEFALVYGNDFFAMPLRLPVVPRADHRALGGRLLRPSTTDPARGARRRPAGRIAGRCSR